MSAVGIVIYSGSVFIIFQCIFVYIPLVYPQYAASLFAGNDFSRSAVAFAFILFSRRMFLNLGVDRGVTLLAGLSVLGIVSPFRSTFLLTISSLEPPSDMLTYTSDRHACSLFLRCESALPIPFCSNLVII